MPADVASLAWVAAAVVAAIVAAIQTVRLLWDRASRSWAAQARLARAADGEVRAESLLANAGYDVLARQVRGGWTIRADGDPLAIGLRADLLVAKDGRRYVAEVKTGALAPRLDHAPTRRQLLEYRIAFDVDGVLLVDAERDRVIVVDMDSEGASEAPRGAPTSWSFAVFVAGLTAGGAIAFVLLR